METFDYIFKFITVLLMVIVAFVGLAAVFMGYYWHLLTFVVCGTFATIYITELYDEWRKNEIISKSTK